VRHQSWSRNKRRFGAYGAGNILESPVLGEGGKSPETIRLERGHRTEDTEGTEDTGEGRVGYWEDIGVRRSVSPIVLVVVVVLRPRLFLGLFGTTALCDCNALSPQTKKRPRTRNDDDDEDDFGMTLNGLNDSRY
jgi:hypothetical protein